MTYVDKNEAITLAQSGFGWTLEMLNTPGQSHNMFRMDASSFYMLHNLLVNKYGLESSLHMNSLEALAIFLVVCGTVHHSVLCVEYSSILERHLLGNLMMS
jgi:hypothetical protein